MTAGARFDFGSQPWFTEAGVRSVLAAIAAVGGEARFVGGVVRDALLGRAAGDVDLAVNLQPDRVTAALTAAGIKVVPTGVEHGTVTAVAGRKGYEITTLRYDVATDGRRATVAFTDDWQADAARRDFTFNALYVDADGALYDYFRGRDDLAAGRVRFIGEAEARIREDVLRILRFFRFYAWFGRGEAEAEGLKACRALAHLLPQLSVERVWNEIGKLLRAPDPVPAWRLMLANGIVAPLVPEAADVERLARVVDVERGGGGENPSPNPSLKGRGIQADGGDALVRLAALLPADADVADRVARRLHMANREGERLKVLAVLPGRLRGALDRTALRRTLYAQGAAAVGEALFLAAADGAGVDFVAALDVVAAWENPVLPIQGGDIVSLGVPPGPRVGDILRAVEAWWMAGDFRAARAACLAEAARLTKVV